MECQRREVLPYIMCFCHNRNNNRLAYQSNYGMGRFYRRNLLALEGFTKAWYAHHRLPAYIINGSLHFRAVPVFLAV